MLADGEREAELEGLIEALGLILALGEELSELDGEREADGEELIELEGESEALGDREADGLIEAEGLCEGEALPPKTAGARYEFSSIGRHKTVNRMRPAVIVAPATVAIMFWETIFSADTVLSSTDASGVASCHISLASMSVAVVVVISPVGAMAVPIAKVPEPVKSTSQTAIILTATVPVTVKSVNVPTLPLAPSKVTL